MSAVSDSLHLTGPQPAPQSVADSAAADTMVFNTVIVDSIGSDTVHGRIPHFIPVDKADSLRVEAYADSIELYSCLPEVPKGSREGIAPVVRGTSLVNDTALTILVVAMLVITGINASSVVKVLKSYRHELLSVRRRPNMFDDERIVSRRAAIIPALVFIVFGGIVLYFLPGLPPSPSFGGVVASMVLTVIYYLFQYTAYSVVGYAFADPEGRRQWLSGFSATQAYTGACLIVPALLLIFEPQWCMPLVWLSAAIYILGRTLFVIKGFRIFFIGFRSLLYFILYLCTLEIIPLLGVCAVNEYLRTYNL